MPILWPRVFVGRASVEAEGIKWIKWSNNKSGKNIVCRMKRIEGKSTTIKMMWDVKATKVRSNLVGEIFVPKSAWKTSVRGGVAFLYDGYKFISANFHYGKERSTGLHWCTYTTRETKRSANTRWA